MNLASPNVMRVLRTRYDMIALLLQTAPKVHHNYAKRIITDNSPQAIITDNSFRRWKRKSYEFREIIKSPRYVYYTENFFDYQEKFSLLLREIKKTQKVFT